MNCLNPLIAISLCKNSEGKNVMKILSDQDLLRFKCIEDLYLFYGRENVFCLPCGKCDNCRSDYSHQWALRCELESYSHRFNYFLTLTYDDEHINKASYKDFQMFIDRLEKYDPSIMYFSACEYGELTNRFHIHCIIFTDYDFRLYNPVRTGKYFHYRSEVLDTQWRFGIHDVGIFEHSCASYVAKYTTKNSKVFMSRNIGKDYFINNYKKIIDDGFKLYCLCDGTNHKAVNIPKCFYKWFSELNLDLSDHKEFLQQQQRSKILLGLSSANLLYEEVFLRSRAKAQLKKQKGIRKL